MHFLLCIQLIQYETEIFSNKNDLIVHKQYNLSYTQPKLLDIFNPTTLKIERAIITITPTFQPY